MNNLLNSIRSFIPENPVSAAITVLGDDMGLDFIKSLQRPPLRKKPSEYDPEEISNFAELCAGNVMADTVEFGKIFSWCVKNDEKNALIWWLEKSQEKTLHLMSPSRGSFTMLSYVFRKNSLIQNLVLYGVVFTEESAKEFGDALKGSQNLKKILLLHIEYPLNSMMFLTEGLSQQLEMKELYVSHSNFTGQDLACLVAALKGCDGVGLTLYGNELKFQDFHAILGAIKQSKTVKSVGFGAEQIDEASMREIGDCLKTVSNLKKLSLFKNNCAPGTAVILEGALMEGGMHEIFLSQNKFDSGAGVNADNLIRESRNLSTLYLSGEELNATEVEKIAKELVHNRRLQCLYLDNVDFNGEGVLALATALQTNTHLCELHLTGSLFPVNAGEILCNAIRVNTTLEKINVEGSNLSAEHRTGMANLCTRNREAKRLMQQDAVLYSRMPNPVALPVELGAVLANQVLMLSNSAAEYESVTTEIALSLRALVTNTRTRPQDADARSRETPQKLSEGCTLI